jgi:hypothetical protein
MWRKWSVHNLSLDTDGILNVLVVGDWAKTQGEESLACDDANN